MATDDLRRRIAEQFDDRDDRADVWRALEWFVDTDRYLNLGYSPRGVPTLLGSSQRRLVDRVGRTLAAELPAPDGRLLDVGAGRGGPAVRLADRTGLDVIGIDLVPANVRRARGMAGTAASFVVGDATALPLRDDSMGAVTAIDSLVYVPAVREVVDEVARVMAPGAPLVVSDLVIRASPPPVQRSAADAFAVKWDMPPLRTVSELTAAMAAAGLRVRSIEDLTPHSVGRFRRYTSPFLWLFDGPLAGAGQALLARAGLDPTVVTAQVRAAHRALPALRHVLVVGRQPGVTPPDGLVVADGSDRYSPSSAPRRSVSPGSRSVLASDSSR